MDYWLAFDDVSPGIAAALSLGLSPKGVDIEQGAVFDRFSLICSWFGIRWKLEPRRGRMPRVVLVGGANETVNLKKLAAKMVEKCIPMPDELAAQAADKSACSGTEKQLGTTERATLLCVIAGLCREAKIDFEARGAAKRIALATEENGTPVSEDTVQRILKGIRAALEIRTK
jgi:hypothetical protein